MGKVIFVDFRKGSVSPSKEIKKTETKIKKNTFKNFNPIIPGSNFEAFSPEERLEYSEHCIEHIHEVSFDDLVHWVNHGMIDIKKVEEKLNLPRLADLVYWANLGMVDVKGIEEKLQLNKPMVSGPKVVGETATSYLVEDDGGFVNIISKQPDFNPGHILGFGLDED